MYSSTTCFGTYITIDRKMWPIVIRNKTYYIDAHFSLVQSRKIYLPGFTNSYMFRP